MRGADGDSERIDAGAGDELLDLFGTGVGGILCGDVHIVLDAGELAELTLNDDAVCVSIFNDLLGEGDVVLKGVL